jgi:hypothetical protein
MFWAHASADLGFLPTDARRGRAWTPGARAEFWRAQFINVAFSSTVADLLIEQLS